MGKNQKSEEKEIDLSELIKVLWNKRKLIVKISLIGFVVGLIVAFSIPKTYTTTVIFAPDENQSSGSMSTIAALTGINFTGGSNTNVLFSPELFPTMLKSTPFLLGLFDIRVQSQDNSIDTTLYVYLKDYQKSPWWSSITSMPSKVLGVFSGNNNTSPSLSNSDDRSYITLSRDEASVINLLKSLLTMSVDKKSNIINLSITMQDPKISAYITDTVTIYLQEYIVNYRTMKARQDLGFTQTLFDETKSDYYKKQQELANYSDANIGIVSAKYATTKERLQNEVNLTYTMYNQMAQELQKTKIKVQDTTPVYTVIEPSVESLLPSGPNKKMAIFAFVIVFFVGASIYVLIKDYLMNKNNKI